MTMCYPWRTPGPRASQKLRPTWSLGRGDRPTVCTVGPEAQRDGPPHPSQHQQPAGQSSPVGEKRSEVTLISGLKCRELMSPGKQGDTSLTTHRQREAPPAALGPSRPVAPPPAFLLSAHAAGESCPGPQQLFRGHHWPPQTSPWSPCSRKHPSSLASRQLAYFGKSPWPGPKV